MNELFELLPAVGLPQDRAVTFVKTLNQLLEMEFVETSQDADCIVHWHISETGIEFLNNALS